MVVERTRVGDVGKKLPFVLQVDVRQFYLRLDQRKIPTDAEGAEIASQKIKVLPHLEFNSFQLRVIVEEGDDVSFLFDAAALNGISEVLVEEADAVQLARTREPFPAQVVVHNGRHTQERIALDKIIDDRVVAVIGRQFAEAGTGDRLAVAGADVHVRRDRVDQTDARQ